MPCQPFEPRLVQRPASGPSKSDLVIFRDSKKRITEWLNDHGAEFTEIRLFRSSSDRDLRIMVEVPDPSAAGLHRLNDPNWRFPVKLRRWA